MSKQTAVSKQGEVEEITKTTHDFKEGLQGTKDADRPAGETEPVPSPEPMVRGEDVIKFLRSKGVKI